jgi:hypothetical protein
LPVPAPDKLKTPKLPDPESLEAKFKILMLLTYEERARRRHCLVFGFILDWFHKDYGNALASVRTVVDKLEERSRLLPGGKGLGQTQVYNTLEDLVAWNFLIKTFVGVGRCGSRYVPNWALVCTSRGENDNCVHTSGNAISVHTSGNANDDHTSGNEDPSTVPGYKTEVRKDGINDCAAALPPPTCGAPGAPVAGPAQDGFDALWLAYDMRKDRAAAKAAYAELNPDADLQATILEAAEAWRQAWLAQGKPDAKRKYLATWLREERYAEDAPGPKKASPTKPAKPAQPTAAPANDNNPLAGRRHAVRIDKAGFVEHDGGKYITLTLVGVGGDIDGQEYEDEICYEHDDAETQDDGQRQLVELCKAAGIDHLEDTDEFEGATIDVKFSRDRSIAYLEPAFAEAA